MRLRFNVLGGDNKVPTGTYVDHTHESPRYDTSELIKFDWSSDDDVDGRFYIDEYIVAGLEDHTQGNKYAWLMEGKEIIPHVYRDMARNIDMYTSAFDAIFTSDKSLYSMHDKIHFVPANTMWVRYPKIYKKSKLVSMISSGNSATDGHKFRLSWMNKLSDSVDVFGRHTNPIPMKEFGLKQYMFSVAIENGSYETYFTEKIIDCFATGTIPVYWGAPDISEHFNPDGIIRLDENFDPSSLSEELYLSKMDAIRDNFERSLQYVVLENYIYDRYLKDIHEKDL